MSVYEGEFAFVLGMVEHKGLLDGRTVSMDSTQLEANAAMKSIVRRESGEDWRAYVKRHRRRVRGRRGRWLKRLRSERAERSFAHSCVTGGARRTWLCGLENVRKRYMAHTAGQNLSTLMRAVCGIGTPRTLQGAAAALLALAKTVTVARLVPRAVLAAVLGLLAHFIQFASPTAVAFRFGPQDAPDLIS